MRRALPVLGTLLFAALTACAGPGGSTASAPPPSQGGSTLYDRLVNQEVPTDSVLRANLDPTLYRPQDPGDIRERVGMSIPVAAPVDFSGVRAGALGWNPRPLAFGAIRTNGAGGFVWSATVETPGATATRLVFEDFHLPSGARLYVYDDLRDVFGPYTGTGLFADGEFWSNTLLGDTVHLQVRYDGTGAADALRTARFTLSEVNHLDSRFPRGLRLDRSFCDYNAGCIENAECDRSVSAVDTARGAVGSMLWQQGAFLYICSGGLIDDTAHDGTPYFLTAHHCIGSNHEAKSLEVAFNYTLACKNNGDYSCPDSFGTKPGTLTDGATLLATTRTSDSTLLLLAQTPPNTTRLGWSLDGVSNSSADLFRISHPMGAPQAISEHQVDPSSSTCQTLPRGDFIYSIDTLGGTEGGSSGSPVLNAAGEIVGQLYGACGTNLNDVCDNQNNWTVDGAFAVSYVDAGYAQWLDPSSGGQCLSKGDQCTVNADCCSNSCKGRPGGKTCK